MTPNLDTIVISKGESNVTGKKESKVGQGLPDAYLTKF